MKKKQTLILAAMALSAVLAGCSGKPAAPATTAAPETTTAAPEATTATPETTAAEAAPDGDSTPYRVGSLKGPTSMGLVAFMDKAQQEQLPYEFTMVTAADELVGKMVNGDLEIALVPANVASVLYNKTKGQVMVIDINTLGVLDIVASDDSIGSIKDLKGKTLYLTGKGTTPDQVIQYLLKENGLSATDVTLEYKSEAAEVAALLKEQPDAIGLLPQPFVTAACAQNENLSIVLDLTKEWQALQGDGGSQLVTGVTVARKEFVENYPDAVAQFLSMHKTSADYANSNPDETAELIVKAGIIEKAPIAKKALPYCNIVCLTGDEMKTALSGYLQVLFDQNPESVGGTVPADDFYYIP